MCSFLRSEEVQGYADDIDLVAPVAVVPENLVGLVGMELAFDGMGSSDNVRITSYKWYMGNGDVLTGPQPMYAYEEPGIYTVTLEVSDEAGNSHKATTTVHIYEKTGKGTSLLTITDEAGVPIPYAWVYLQMGNGEALSLRADSYGRVTIAGDVGAHIVAAYADEYLPREIQCILAYVRTTQSVSWLSDFEKLML